MTHAVRLPEGTVAHAEGNHVELIRHELGHVAILERPIEYSGIAEPINDSATYEQGIVQSYDRKGHVSKNKK